MLQQSTSIALIAGARSFSLGEAIAREISATVPDCLVVTIDREHGTFSSQQVKTIALDLNPLHRPGGYSSWSSDLQGAFNAAVASRRLPIKAVFLCLARYHVGKYEDTPVEQRIDLLGCNLLGKYEILHHAMNWNATRGYSNTDTLDIYDFGSLHSIIGTPHRALYNSTKAASLSMCHVLLRGNEVRRAFHIAPAHVDTPMLHWNHWVLKEDGNPILPDLIRSRFPDRYRQIFCDCDPVELEGVLTALNITNHSDAHRTLGRYRQRRLAALASPEGIASPSQIAKYLGTIFTNTQSLTSGTLVIKAPNGELVVQHDPFKD